MRYHYEPPETYFAQYGTTYECDHPVYNECTLYKIGSLGLAVIQQRYISESKMTYWGAIDPWLIDELYLHKGFLDYFKRYAAEPDENGIYPTVTVRQIMWKLRLSPIIRAKWETVFDKCPI